MSVVLLAGSPNNVQLEISKLVSLEQAGFTDGYLPVRELDRDHIESLIACELQDTPAIEVVNTTRGYALIDGRHRVTAAAALKRSTILSHIGTYTCENDVIDAAFQANLRHGLPANHESRSDYAIWLYSEYKLTQAEIAKRTGLSQPTVSRIIRKALKDAELADKVDQLAEDDTERTYLSEQKDYTKKLLNALNAFFENETSLFGSNTGTRSEKKRAKALLLACTHTPANAAMFQSLGRTFTQVATMMTAPAAK